MKYTIFGESHGPAIGVVLEGVPAGLELDLDFIRAQLARRAPGQNAMTTARKEADEPEILSGVFEGKTTGTPLCAVIFNKTIAGKSYIYPLIPFRWKELKKRFFRCRLPHIRREE